MAQYLTPGVYIEDINQIVDMPVGTDPTAAFLGIAKTGAVGKPVLIESWNAFLSEYATGQDTAFLTDSYLAYAVYGFFQNGGKKCYIIRVTDADVTGNTLTYKAKSALSSGAEQGEALILKEGIFTAKSEGIWGNNLKIETSIVDSDTNTFSLSVSYNGIVVESWSNLKNTASTKGCFAEVINSESKYITVRELNYTFIKGTGGFTFTFSGGDDGMAQYGEPVPNTVYENTLKELDFYEEIRLVAIPGADKDLQTKVAEYCTNHKYRIAICEGLETSTNEDLLELRSMLNNLNAILYSNWIKVVNPNSSTSENLISVPACGHICGVFSRISDSRGFWKVPAGTEANIRGAVAVTRILTQAQTDILNPKGINAIIPKTNSGICIWGARSCNPNFTYFSDLYMNITLKKNLYDLTQKYVFEPHDSVLWEKVKTTCQDYLNSLYQQGALFGGSSKEAYYVKCDEELNPISVRNQGKLICEIGYAVKKPAEFIVFRISHELTIA